MSAIERVLLQRQGRSKPNYAEDEKANQKLALKLVQKPLVARLNTWELSIISSRLHSDYRRSLQSLV